MKTEGVGFEPHAEGPVILRPTAGQRPLGPAELDVLAAIGRHWRLALGGRRVERAHLPVDPDVTASAVVERTQPYERLVRGGREVPQVADLVAGEGALAAPDLPAWLLKSARRLFVGPPLLTTALLEERLNKVRALAVLSSDALSSVAYGTEAMLSVLVLAGAGALWTSLPLGGLILLLLLAVGMSYRQTIKAYPRGGGSYIVARDNLGEVPGLTAAAGLMCDYVLTIAVSVSAGAAAVTSAFPQLNHAQVALAVGCIGAVAWGNLRGLRQASSLFSLPAYLFVAGILALIGVGLFHAGNRGWTTLPVPAIAPIEQLGIFLVLKAFASGSSAMTGVEAIADGVPAFEPPEWRNARTTLTWMVGLLAVLFGGVTLLAHLDGVVPNGRETVLSQLAALTFGRGPAYLFIQVSTALILTLAANTAFSDFPRLLYFLARDRYAPLMFLRMGDRLGHSNGIIAVALSATVLVIVFGAQTEALISLYAVGVFLSFTLSQSGMIRRWWVRREAGWRRGLPVNGFGALLSAIVLVVVLVAKFTAGAWMVAVVVPVLILLFRRIHRHYVCAEAAMSPHPLDPDHVSRHLAPYFRGNKAPVAGPVEAAEAAESPDEIVHLAVVPVTSLNLPALRALAYAVSLGQPVIGLHVSADEEDSARIRAQWEAWGNHLPLQVILSPYRLVVIPIVNYLDRLEKHRPGITLTVVLPEIAVPRWWQNALHNQVPFKLRVPLRHQPGVVITSVPFHLPPDC